MKRIRRAWGTGLADSEQRQRRFLRITIYVLLSVTGVVVVSYLLMGPERLPWNARTTTITGAVGVIYLAALLAEHRGRQRAAVCLLAGGTILGSWAPVLVPGGIQGDRSYFFVGLNILIVSLAVGARTGAVVAGIDVVLLTYLQLTNEAYAWRQYIEDLLMITVFASVFLTLSWAREADRQDMEEHRHRLEETLVDTAAILETSQDAIVSLDSSGTVILSNPVARGLAKAMFGIRLEPGERPIPRLPPTVRREVEEALVTALREGSIRIETMWGPQPRWYDIRLQAVRAHDATFGVTMQLRDITDMRRAAMRERELYRERMEVEKLREVDQFKTRLLNVASHELRTPLTPMRLQLAVLRAHLHEIPERLHSGVGVLERNARRLGVLVDDLLDVSRLESGKLPLMKEPMDLCQTAREAVEDFEATARERGVELLLECPGPVPVEGDRDRLGQVASNLLTNALKFTPGGGQVTVRCVAEDGKAVLAVEDTGKGFAPGEAGAIFQPFYQLEPLDKGSGLGLYICRGIMRLHDGRISASSEGTDRGATFTIHMPLRAGASVGGQGALAQAAASNP